MRTLAELETASTGDLVELAHAALRRLAARPAPDCPITAMELAERLGAGLDLGETALARIVAVADAAGEPAARRYAGTRGWLKVALGMRTGRADERLTLARQLPRLPVVARMLRAEELSFGYAATIADSVAQLSDADCAKAEEVLLGLVAEGLSATKVAKVGARIKDVIAERDGTDDPGEDGRRGDRSWWRLAKSLNGAGAVKGWFDPELLALVNDRLGPLAKPTGPEDDRDHAQRMADALRMMLAGDGSNWNATLVIKLTEHDHDSASAAADLGVDWDTVFDPAGATPTRDGGARDRRPGATKADTDPSGAPDADGATDADRDAAAGKDLSDLSADAGDVTVGGEADRDGGAAAGSGLRIGGGADGGGGRVAPGGADVGTGHAGRSAVADWDAAGGKHTGGRPDVEDDGAVSGAARRAPVAFPRPGGAPAGAGAPERAMSGSSRAADAVRYPLWPLQNAQVSARLADGTPIRPEQARIIALNAGVSPVILGPDGIPLYLGRRARLVTSGQRRVLEALYQTCACDECDIPVRFCQLDHVFNWTDGGTTDIDRLAPACSFHNRLKYAHPEWVTVSRERTGRWRYSIRRPRFRHTGGNRARGP